MCEATPDQPAAAPLTRRALLASTAAATAGATVVGLADRAHAHPGTEEAAVDVGRPPTRPVVAPPLVVEGGSLLDPYDGSVVEDSVVVLVEGRVLAAGSRSATWDAVAQLRERAGPVQTVDASGSWVLPGLIDVHVHVNALADAAGVLSAGATSVRSGTSTFYQDVALRALPRWVPGRAPRMKAAGVFVTPALGDTVLADPRLAPLAALPDGVRSLPELRYLTRVNVARGVDVVKTRVNERAGLPDQDPLLQVYDREQIAAIVSAAGRAPVLCHSYSAQGCDDAVRGGVRSLEHGVFVTERTIARMVRRGTYFTPTMKAIADLALSPDPVLADRGRRYLPVLEQAVLAAYEAGVDVVAGTDTFGAATRPIGSEVALLVEAGIPPLDALRATTTTAARLLGTSRSVGRLRRGYRADLVVAPVDPVADITALTRLQLVVAQGAVVRNDLPSRARAA